MKLFIFVLSSIFLFDVQGAYYSQCGQDKFVHENYFQSIKGGFFVDIGAHDGVSLSNTYFFETEMNWSGLCVEPTPETFAQLTKNRKCHCVNGCIANHKGVAKFLDISHFPGKEHIEKIDMLSGLIDKFDPRHLDRIELAIEQEVGTAEVIEVQCFLLNELLDELNVYHVDFLSIDTEGGEFEILESIDFSRFQIDVITVENNYGDPRFIPFLESKGYRFVEALAQDLLFINKIVDPVFEKKKQTRAEKRRERRKK